MTVYLPKNSPYYYSDFQRGGKRYCGSTKRKDQGEAEAIELAEIERAEREQEVAYRSANAPEVIAHLPRHVIRERTRSLGWKYAFIVPKRMRRAGCPLRDEQLGTDHEAAVIRAETVLLPQLDAWWSEYLAASRAPTPPTSKPGIPSESAKPSIGVYLLMQKGKVVYVGSSLRMPARVARHRQNGRPFDQVFYIGTTEKERLKLEAELIRSLDPTQNKVGRRSPRIGTEQVFDQHVTQ
ncbi:hypothetical protein DYI24_12795 [Rhodopseudomonas sp. BR0C11]|uniref:hypothetical protein n=1 Tax=Rhodopseudomonas sp. BR0C11 TaxID=2269370 RepID=UPI0013DEC402|nr:hypothetical protein [Rhodopseudomonas sp. BR0C11]NEV77915.1 hypothetical protein [Rhodopseudomonas sp. BR0C11]